MTQTHKELHALSTNSSIARQVTGDHFHKMCRSIAGSSFLNVSVCCFSLSYMIVDEEHLGIALLVTQEKVNWTLMSFWALGKHVLTIYTLNG